MCLLVDFGKVSCSSAKHLQQNSNTSSREDYIPQILTVLLEILRIYMTSVTFCLLSVKTAIRKQLIAKTMQLLRRPISASDPIADRFYVISIEFLSLSGRRSSARNVPSGEEPGETDVFAG